MEASASFEVCASLLVRKVKLGHVERPGFVLRFETENELEGVNWTLLQGFIIGDCSGISLWLLLGLEWQLVGSQRVLLDRLLLLILELRSVHVPRHRLRLLILICPIILRFGSLVLGIAGCRVGPIVRHF